MSAQPHSLHATPDEAPEASTFSFHRGVATVTWGRSLVSATTTIPLRSWLSVRHSLGLEAALVVSLYGLYELARGPRRR